MKALLIYFGLIISLQSAIGQNSIVGCYGRQDSQIKLNADSTFFFFYAVDTYRGWLKGTWVLKRSRIILKPNLVYDTIMVKSGEQTVDSLVLSRDYTSDRILQTQSRAFQVFQYEQNERICPQLLKYKADLLFVVKNKKIQKRKIKNGYYIKSFNPWYTKSQCKY